MDLIEPAADIGGGFLAVAIALILSCYLNFSVFLPGPTIECISFM